MVNACPIMSIPRGAVRVIKFTKLYGVRNPFDITEKMVRLATTKIHIRLSKIAKNIRLKYFLTNTPRKRIIL